LSSSCRARPGPSARGSAVISAAESASRAPTLTRCAVIESTCRLSAARRSARSCECTRTVADCASAVGGREMRRAVEVSSVRGRRDDAQVAPLRGHARRRAGARVEQVEARGLDRSRGLVFRASAARKLVKRTLRLSPRRCDAVGSVPKSPSICSCAAPCSSRGRGRCSSLDLRRLLAGCRRATSTADFARVDK